MFMSRSFSLSFIFTIALIFLVLDVSNASEHAFNHKPARLLKKRLAAASSSSTSSSSGSTQSSSDSASHTLQNTNSDSSIPSTTSAADPTSSSSATSSLVSTSLASSNVLPSSLLSSISALVQPTSSSASKSSNAVSSSSPATSSTLSVSQLAPAASTSSSANAIITQVPPSSGDDLDDTSSVVETYTMTSQTSPTPSVAAATTPVASTSISKPVLIIIVIASCIGGAILIWTIIRKWKFRPSSQFEDRIQPIDWQPFGNDPASDLRRNASTASHGSFHSGSEHESSFGRDHLADLPAHDFTAGAAHTYGDGYLDVDRGYNAQPAMVQTLTRGPSFNAGYSTTGYYADHQGSAQY